MREGWSFTLIDQGEVRLLEGPFDRYSGNVWMTADRVMVQGTHIHKTVEAARDDMIAYLEVLRGHHSGALVRLDAMLLAAKVDRLEGRGDS